MGVEGVRLGAGRSSPLRGRLGGGGCAVRMRANKNPRLRGDGVGLAFADCSIGDRVPAAFGSYKVSGLPCTHRLSSRRRPGSILRSGDGPRPSPG